MTGDWGIRPKSQIWPCAYLDLPWLPLSWSVKWGRQKLSCRVIGNTIANMYLKDIQWIIPMDTSSCCSPPSQLAILGLLLLMKKERERKPFLHLFIFFSATIYDARSSIPKNALISSCPSPTPRSCHTPGKIKRRFFRAGFQQSLDQGQGRDHAPSGTQRGPLPARAESLFSHLPSRLPLGKENKTPHEWSSPNWLYCRFL